jgi:hypothetical protein
MEDEDPEEPEPQQQQQIIKKISQKNPIMKESLNKLNVLCPRESCPREYLFINSDNTLYSKDGLKNAQEYNKT